MRDITLSPAADYHAVGYLLMVTEAYTLHRRGCANASPTMAAVPRSSRAGSDRERPRHRTGDASPSRAVPGDGGGDARSRCPVSASPGGEAPRIADAEMGQHGEAVLHHAVQRHRLPAISICTGFGEGGLPVSMRNFAGKPFSEPRCCSARRMPTKPPCRGGAATCDVRLGQRTSGQVDFRIEPSRVHRRSLQAGQTRQRRRALVSSAVEARCSASKVKVAGFHPATWSDDLDRWNTSSGKFSGGMSTLMSSFPQEATDSRLTVARY